MESQDRLKELLTERLEMKGIEKSFMRGFLSHLLRVFATDPDIRLSILNNRLKRLGWYDINIDYHTFQIAKAYFEFENLNKADSKMSWFYGATAR